MKKLHRKETENIRCMLLGALLAAGLFCGVFLAPGWQKPVRAEELTAQDTLKNADLVTAVNMRTRDQLESGVTDVSKLGGHTAEEVKKMILSYSFPEGNFIDGEPVSQEAKDGIMSRRNLEHLTDPVTVRYGIITENASVRSFPTWSSNTLEEGSKDLFQESMFTTGEGAVVYHTTEDGSWCFVQGNNYTGWIEQSHLAYCSQAEMKTFLEGTDFAVVTAAKLVIGTHTFRMGTRLPAGSYEETGITVWIPRANESGNLYYESVRLENTEGISRGYLEYTEENVIAQASRLVDTPYGWGDSNGNMDCSSTMGAIYRCFGIVLPRNTGQMRYSGIYSQDVTKMGAEEKKTYIESLNYGTLLLMKGHVVMYYGKNQGVPMILHNVTQYVQEGILREENKCVITPLEISGSGGTSYLDLIQCVILMTE